MIYISGAGRSGSTLLDIILGNQAGHQSLGEMGYLLPNAILDNEYCSCNNPVSECPHWSKIIKAWESKMTISLEEYYTLQKTFLRNKKSFYVFVAFLIKSKKFNLLVDNTRLLYECIYENSDKQIFIDSSKTPQRILLLRSIKLPLQVIHLKRNYKGVLNSKKKAFKKDSSKGIERDMKPQSTIFASIVYLIDNYLTILFSIGIKRKVLHYENLIAQPEKEIQRVAETDKQALETLKNRGPFYAEHLVAGNMMRMSNSIFIQKKNTDNETHPNLNTFDKIIAFIINILTFNKF